MIWKADLLKTFFSFFYIYIFFTATNAFPVVMIVLSVVQTGVKSYLLNVEGFVQESVARCWSTTPQHPCSAKTQVPQFHTQSHAIIMQLKTNRFEQHFGDYCSVVSFP